jgi:hypothetical protein
MGVSYPLAELIITHPDDDHVRNASNVAVKMTPYILVHEPSENFNDSDTINEDYNLNLNKKYIFPVAEKINWGFDEFYLFQIPIASVKSDENLKSKERNNNSFITFIKYCGCKILFAGDLERPGWTWLCENDSRFAKIMQDGLDILIAPHHGHKSGFPTELFKLTGNVKTVILSKGTEKNKDGTDVSSQYSSIANGIDYCNLNDSKYYRGKVLSTRENGHIYIKIINNNDIPQVNVWCKTASSNHECLSDDNA